MTPPVDPCPCSASRMGPEPSALRPQPCSLPRAGPPMSGRPPVTARSPQGFSELGYLPESPSVPLPARDFTALSAFIL